MTTVAAEASPPLESTSAPALDAARPSKHPARRPWAILGAAVVLVIVAGALAFAIIGKHPPGIDDAYITFVYGRNLERGFGLVFIPGGERVEGMTSMGWTLVSALVLAFTERPELPLLLVSGALLVLTITRVHRIVTFVAGDPDDAEWRRLLLLLTIGWASCQPGLFAWNVLSLMESSLWTFLVCHTTACLVESSRTGFFKTRNHLGLAASASAMLLTRPESLAIIPVLWLWTALLVTLEIGARASARRFLPSLVVAAAFAVSLVGFRLAYFGYSLPNTYYAKHVADLAYSLMKGARYLVKFLALRPWNTALLAILVWVSWGVVRRLSRRDAGERERGVLIVSAAVLLFLAIPFQTSGDAFGEFRFYQPIVLLLIVPSAYLLSRTLPPVRPLERLRGRLRLSLAVAGGALVLGSVWYFFSRSHELEGEFTCATTGQRVGRALTRSVKSDRAEMPSLGVIGAGGTAWTYEGPVVDLLGLNWTAMAHSNADRRGVRTGHGAFSQAIFWSRPPDVLVLDLQAGAFCSPETAASSLDTWIVTTWLRGLTSSPEFAQAFEAGCLGEGVSSVAGFFSRRWLNRRHPDGYRRLK